MDRRRFEEISFESLFYFLKITFYTYIRYFLTKTNNLRENVKKFAICSVFINNRSGSTLIFWDGNLVQGAKGWVRRGGKNVRGKRGIRGELGEGNVFEVK